MRIIVYGIGAIGGTIAARLTLTGTEVIGIARGGMLDAIRSQGGLSITTPEGNSLASFPVVADPADIDWRANDVILLTMKSNDTETALRALVDAGVTTQSIACAQNGVANEFMALRHFKHVIAMVIMTPAEYLEPGKVVAVGTPKTGLIELGDFPAGVKNLPSGLAGALTAAGFICDVREDAMAGKYGKLLQNLGNIVEAALGQQARFGPWNDLVRHEGEAVLTAAGRNYYSVDKGNPKLELVKFGAIPGFARAGSSSIQSLLRGTGSIETEFLNGEIVLLGRLHNVDTPVNEAFVRVARQMLRDRIAPGDFPEDDIKRFMAEK